MCTHTHTRVRAHTHTALVDVHCLQRDSRRPAVRWTPGLGFTSSLSLRTKIPLQKPFQLKHHIQRPPIIQISSSESYFLSEPVLN